MSKLLCALGMRQATEGAQGGRSTGASASLPAAVKQAAGPTQTTAAAEHSESQAAVLTRTLTALGMGCCAPPLPGGMLYHVAIVHDPSQDSAHGVCSALKAALTAAFPGAKVFLAVDPREVPAAVEAAACVFPFLTLGLLKGSGSAAVAAVAAGLRLRRRFVAAYETERGRGGTPSVRELIEQTAAEAEGLWGFTAFPWLSADPEFMEVCALRLLLDGVMDGVTDCAASGATCAGAASAAAAVTPPSEPAKAQNVPAPAAAVQLAASPAAAVESVSAPASSTLVAQPPADVAELQALLKEERGKAVKALQELRAEKECTLKERDDKEKALKALAEKEKALKERDARIAELVGGQKADKERTEAAGQTTATAQPKAAAVPTAAVAPPTAIAAEAASEALAPPQPAQAAVAAAVGRVAGSPAQVPAARPPSAAGAGPSAARALRGSS